MRQFFTRLTPAPFSLLLLLSGVAAAAIAGCGAKAQPVADQAKKFVPVDESQAATTTEVGAAQSADGRSAVRPASGQSEFTAANAAGEAQQFGSGGNAASATGKGNKGEAAKGQVAATPEVQQLVDQWNKLAEQQPKGKTQQEQLEDFVRTQQQRLTIGKKILSLNPDGHIKQQIVGGMYQLYMMFERAGVPTARQQINEFAKMLSADRDPEVSRMGRHMTFDTNVSRIASSPNPEGKAIVSEVQKLLDAEKGALDEQTLDLAGQAAEILIQSGMKDDGIATYELIASAAAADPKVADKAAKYSDSARLAKSDLSTLLSNVIGGGNQQDEQKLMAAVSTLLKDLKPSRDLFANVQQVAQMLEHTGHPEAAKQTYDALSQKFKDSTDAPLAEAAAQMSERAQKRLSMIGQPLQVEGMTIDGKPFDWSPYKGKVVLLDFWATWCGPCLDEIPNIEQNFQQFHAKGFEVVGVNLNTKLSDIKEFFSVQSLPWPSVTSQVVLDGKADEDNWSKLPMASKCGVDAIPFLVLIGKDGNVDSIHVRGPKLKNRLTQLLGEPITTDIPSDPTQPAPPGPAPRTGAKPGPGKQSRLLPPRGIIAPLAALVAGALFAAELAETPTSEDASINPYKAKAGLSATQLAAYIEKMLDRPQAIQKRPGFADAIVDACDRILAAEPPAKESEQLLAIESKFAVLHREACDGNDAADKQLLAFAEKMKDDSRQQVARDAAFFRLERRVIDAKEMPVDEIPALLKEVQEFVAKEKLTARHLRLASSTVAAINRLESGDEREAQFAKFGNLFAKSNDKDVARYGKKLAKKRDE
jgi:thiol-disulfide isomerase/thioredoxin